MCPKCMHKSADEERVCGRCGALLLSAAQRRKMARGPAEAHVKRTRSENGSGSGASSMVLTAGDGVATKDGSAEAIAIREALEYLDTSGDRRSSEDRRSPTDRRTATDRRFAGDRRATRAGPTSGHKVSRAWLITIGVTVLVAIGFGVFLGLRGGTNASGTVGTTASSTSAKTVSLFQFTGSGPSTTGPFTATAAFTFSYTVSCQGALQSPAVFELLRAGHAVGGVATGVGGVLESGNEPSFGTSGTFTVQVNAPVSCTWTVSGGS